jgi:hypothetical protein
VIKAKNQAKSWPCPYYYLTRTHSVCTKLGPVFHSVPTHQRQSNTADFVPSHNRKARAIARLRIPVPFLANVVR